MNSLRNFLLNTFVFALISLCFSCKTSQSSLSSNGGETVILRNTRPHNFMVTESGVVSGKLRLSLTEEKEIEPYKLSFEKMRNLFLAIEASSKAEVRSKSTGMGSAANPNISVYSPSEPSKKIIIEEYQGGSSASIQLYNSAPESDFIREIYDEIIGHKQTVNADPFILKSSDHQQNLNVTLSGKVTGDSVTNGFKEIIPFTLQKATLEKLKIAIASVGEDVSAEAFDPNAPSSMDHPTVLVYQGSDFEREIVIDLVNSGQKPTKTGSPFEYWTNKTPQAKAIRDLLSEISKFVKFSSP